MDKEKIINYIERLEASARQTDTYFKERNDLYIENQRLNNIINELEDYKSRCEKAVKYIKENAWYMYKDNEKILDRIGIEGLLKILEGDNNE